MAVRIVVDSTADLPPDLAREYDMSIVPLSVIFGDEVLREGIDITAEEFYDRLARSRTLPTTSAPSVGDFLAVYESLLEETDEIISIHISSKLSATYSVACQAAENLKEKGRIEVIDSKYISLGIGFLAMAAGRAAQGGASLDQVKAIVERGRDRIHSAIMVDTLEYLRRGGRIGRARAFLGTVLRVKPLLSIRDGEIYPLERIRTRGRALERIFDICMAYPRIETIGVAYSTTPFEAAELERRFAAAAPYANVYMTRLGPVLGTHVGPGVIGAGVMLGEE